MKISRSEKVSVAVEPLHSNALPGRDISASAAGQTARGGFRQTINTILIALMLFLAALGVRLLSWQDTRREAWKVQSVVAEDYKRVARILREGGISSFLSPSSPLSDPNTLGHPPGYSLLLALLYSLFGESDGVTHLFQIICDALAAVILFLIVAELLPRSVAVTGAMLVALSPQFAWNAMLLLPDSLAVLPILLAVYCIARALKRPRLSWLLAAGALVGLSCWLRANALLLAPFLALTVPFLFERGQRLRYAAMLLGGAILIIAPLTVRNAVVFRHFIPLSLGAGQTLLEGISDYDTEKRFGIPDTDMGIMKMEAERYHRPDYYGTLFNPDGVKRERMRLAEGFKIILSHPVWFAGVMSRRGASMFRLERTRLISAEPPISHELDMASQHEPIWANSPAELASGGTRASQGTTISVVPGVEALRMVGDETVYGKQFISAPISISKDTDYLLSILVKPEQGRVSFNVVRARSDVQYASAIVETLEGKTPAEQPVNTVQIPFVSGSDEQVQVVIANNASKPAPPVVEIRGAALYELGPATNLWTRYVRLPLRAVQKLFITAVMLPLTLIGILLLLLRQRRMTRSLAVLMLVPAYYLFVQSATHTEYRYVLVIHYFFFALAAVTIAWAGAALLNSLRQSRLLQRFRVTSRA